MGRLCSLYIFFYYDSFSRSPKIAPKRKRVSDGDHIELHSSLAKKIKDKFRSDMSSVIVRHLKPYLADSCETGHITNHDDFRHLARKVILY